MFAARNARSLLAVVAALALSASAAHSQGLFGLAPPGATDTLNAAPTGAPSPFALNRAQGLGATLGIGAAPGAATAAPVDGGQPGAAPPTFTAFSPFAPQVTAKQVKVIGGSRVYCHVTQELLDDARVQYVSEDEAKQNYFDDGTHGDQIAGDGVYTNIGEDRNDVLSMDADILRRRVQAAVIQAEARSPLDFFMLHVLTIEPVSLVPREMDKEQERDGNVSRWAKSFLEAYRVNPEDPKSEFWPLFIPPPPAKPQGSPPPGFDLTNLPPQLATGGAGQQPGDAGAGPMMLQGAPGQPPAGY